MKKLAFTLLPLLLAYSMFAQITQNRDCGNFTGIKISGALKVVLTENALNSVKVVALEEYMPKIITAVKNGILEVYTKDGSFKSDIIVYITAKALNTIETSGAVKMENTNLLNADKLAITSSGASEIKLELKVNELKTHNSGASNIKLWGKTSRLNAEISGASNLKAYNLSANIVDVTTTGASNAKVNATEKITVAASGASEVNYTGAASDKNIEKTGASRINHKSGNAEEDK